MAQFPSFDRPAHFDDDSFDPSDSAEDDDDEKTLLSSSQEHNLSPFRSTALPTRKSFWTIFALIFLLSVSCSLNIYLALKPYPRLTEECHVTDEQCTQHLSPYSPIIDNNLIKYNWTVFNGSFLANSPWRGPPSYEREIAWDKLWRRHAIDIPAEKLPLLDKDPEVTEFMRTPVEAGGGYAAMLEVHHQLHCLSTIRQFAYRNVYLAEMGGLPEGLRASEELVLAHLDHCLEILRMNLMCTSDVTPILIKMDDSYPAGHILDFSTKHNCRNFDAITEWADKHVAIP